MLEDMMGGFGCLLCYDMVTALSALSVTHEALCTAIGLQNTT